MPYLALEPNWIDVCNGWYGVVPAARILIHDPNRTLKRLTFGNIPSLLEAFGISTIATYEYAGYYATLCSVNRLHFLEYYSKEGLDYFETLTLVIEPFGNQ